jgi:site-specific DNA-methyltransferase (adenine-specific)
VSERRQPTATSSFGVSRRENHDASGFYARFQAPEISDDDVIKEPEAVDRIICGDARQMDEVTPNSVALVVTSPPYFAGKEYELATGRGHVPGDYLEYLTMLTEVFAECVDKLEPGGRIAVNVANLGRKPYRSLSADVIAILQDELRLLLRGEIVWVKGRGATGNCAWGSFQQPGNPVLRDLTERVVVASKGRFDRARKAGDRAASGLPSSATVTKDEFMEATLDLWELPTESATRVGHPAPFPVELPERLIELYTYEDDLVLDPFMGSGTTAVAAQRRGRRYVGYDTEQDYVDVAEHRLEVERADRNGSSSSLDGGSDEGGLPTDLAELVADGEQAARLAEPFLEEAGFTEIDVPPRGVRVGRTTVALAATDRAGQRWLIDVVGASTVAPSGLGRNEVFWRTLGNAAVIRAEAPGARLLVLTTQPPAKVNQAALNAVQDAGTIDGVVTLPSADGFDELRRLAAGDQSTS